MAASFYDCAALFAGSNEATRVSDGSSGMSMGGSSLLKVVKLAVAGAWLALYTCPEGWYYSDNIAMSSLAGLEYRVCIIIAKSNELHGDCFPQNMPYQALQLHCVVVTLSIAATSIFAAHVASMRQSACSAINHHHGGRAFFVFVAHIDINRVAHDDVGSLRRYCVKWA